jgi:outer membrane lipoprotein-sorting protein
VQGVPREQWYYSRFVIWIADDTLPLREEFYDPSGSLWKVETWGQVTRIDGTPVPLLIRMEDIRQGESTELRVSDLLWDRELPDDLFDTRNLPKAAHSPLWNTGGH